MKVNIKRLTETAIVPTKGHETDVGFDLYADETACLKAQESMGISTGISVSIPVGYYGRIAPRSGHANKFAVDVLAGVVDPGYTGEIKVILVNHGGEHFPIEAGKTKIAQLIFEKCEANVEWNEVEDLEQTKRGEKGFGSTDMKKKEYPTEPTKLVTDQRIKDAIERINKTHEDAHLGKFQVGPCRVENEKIVQ